MNTKDIETFSEVLDIFAKRSTCARLQVASLLIKNGRIISTGWNGVPAGMEHCEHVFAGQDMTDPEVKEKHRLFSEDNELHAEQNCIANAPIRGEGCDIFVSVSPCKQCAKLIIAEGIKSVYYKTHLS